MGGAVAPDGKLERDILVGLERIEQAAKSATEPLASTWRQQHSSLVLRLKEVTTATKDLSDQVARIRKDQLALHEKVDGLTASLDEMRTQLELSDSRTEARAELTRLNTELNERFSARREIRRLTESLLSELGTAAIRDGVVDRETVRQLAGQHLFKDADFWLAPAAVAIAAEHLGEEARRAHAWALADTRDRARTALFLALVYSRLGQAEPAARSMNSYLDSVDHRSLGQEFFQVLNALAERELGEKAFSYAEQTLRRWATELDASRTSADASYAAQTETCRELLLHHHNPLPESDYLRLRGLAAKQWPTIEEDWRYATACHAAAANFRRRLTALGAPVDGRAGGRGGPSRERGHARLALRALVQQPEADELELLRRIRLQGRRALRPRVRPLRSPDAERSGRAHPLAPRKPVMAPAGGSSNSSGPNRASSQRKCLVRKVSIAFLALASWATNWTPCQVSGNNRVSSRPGWVLASALMSSIVGSRFRLDASSRSGPEYFLRPGCAGHTRTGLTAMTPAAGGLRLAPWSRTIPPPAEAPISTIFVTPVAVRAAAALGMLCA
jgi:hypothetical protein